MLPRSSPRQPSRLTPAPPPPQVGPGPALSSRGGQGTGRARWLRDRRPAPNRTEGPHSGDSAPQPAPLETGRAASCQQSSGSPFS